MLAGAATQKPSKLSAGSLHSSLCSTQPRWPAMQEPHPPSGGVQPTLGLTAWLGGCFPCLLMCVGRPPCPCLQADCPAAFTNVARRLQGSRSHAARALGSLLMTHDTWRRAQASWTSPLYSMQMLSAPAVAPASLLAGRGRLLCRRGGLGGAAHRDAPALRVLLRPPGRLQQAQAVPGGKPQHLHPHLFATLQFTTPT